MASRAMILSVDENYVNVNKALSRRVVLSRRFRRYITTLCNILALAACSLVTLYIFRRGVCACVQKRAHMYMYKKRIVVNEPKANASNRPGRKALSRFVSPRYQYQTNLRMNH